MSRKRTLNINSKNSIRWPKLRIKMKKLFRAFVNYSVKLETFFCYNILRKMKEKKCTLKDILVT